MLRKIDGSVTQEDVWRMHSNKKIEDLIWGGGGHGAFFEVAEGEMVGERPIRTCT